MRRDVLRVESRSLATRGIAEATLSLRARTAARDCATAATAGDRTTADCRVFLRNPTDFALI